MRCGQVIAGLIGVLISLVGGCSDDEGMEGAPCGDACGRDGQTLCLRCSAGDVCLDLFLPPPPGQPTNITHCYGEAGRVCECLLSEYPVFDCRPEANGQEVLYSPLVCAAVERQSRLDQGP